MNSYFQRATKLSLFAVIMLVVLASNINVISAAKSFAMGSTYGYLPPGEPELGEEAADRVCMYTGLMGWTTYDWYGSHTTKIWILEAASGYGAAKAISFYIGHGSVDYFGNYFIVDDTGVWVYDIDIYYETEDQNTKYILLWSCEQGDGVWAMPWAWLHTSDISHDGYHNPDFGGLAFIGFREIAPFLVREIDGVKEAGFKFIDKFYFWLAAPQPRYINSALDRASLYLWGVDFDDCPLYTDPDYEMRVYGDGFFDLVI